MSEERRPSKPSYLAFNDQELENGRSIFDKVGASFAHKDAKGHNVELDSVPLHGNITLREQQDRLEDMRNYTVSDQLSHNTFHVRNTEDGKSFFNKLGPSYAHTDGKGHTLKLNSAPVNGRITMREPKDRLQTMREETPPQQQAMPEKQQEKPAPQQQAMTEQER